MLYLGIDQHRSQLTVNLRSEDGTVLLQRQVSTKWERIRAFFADLTERAAGEDGFMAIVEVCGMNPWLIDMLHEYGCREIVVTQPEHKSKRKTDRRDAAFLSNLLWLNRQRLAQGHPVPALAPTTSHLLCVSASSALPFPTQPGKRLLELSRQPPQRPFSFPSIFFRRQAHQTNPTAMQPSPPPRPIPSPPPPSPRPKFSAKCPFFLLTRECKSVYCHVTVGDHVACSLKTRFLSGGLASAVSLHQGNRNLEHIAHHGYFVHKNPTTDGQRPGLLPTSGCFV